MKTTTAHPSELSEANFIVLNTDFVAHTIDAPRLAALSNAYLTGVISWPTLFYNLQQGEVYPDAWKQEDEEGALKTAPVLTPPKNPEAEDDDDASEST